MINFNVIEAMDLLHSYANQMNALQDEISELYAAYDFLPNSMRLRIDNDMRDLNDLINPISSNLKSYYLASNHGGSRSGSGRKKQEPTKQIRIPESIADLILELKDSYNSLDSDSKYLVRLRLIEFLNDISS